MYSDARTYKQSKEQVCAILEPMQEPSIPFFVGVDIGTTAVRCVVGEMAGDATQPSIIGFSEVENSGMRKGNVAHAEEIVQALVSAVNEAERTSGRTIKSATINVNGSHVQGLNSKGVIAISSANREISVDDRARVEEAATIVQLPANKDIIQVFAKNYRVDGQDNIKDPVGMHGVRLEVDTHIVLAATPALKNLEQVLERAEVRPSHRTVSGLAAAEAVLDRKQKESGALVVDIGAGTTNLTVIEDGEVEHVAVIPMGGMHVTNDLAIGLKTELEIAEMVKIKHATLHAKADGETSLVKDGQQYHFDRGLMRMIVSARMEELFEFIDKELKKIHRSKKLPGGVVLVGGGSQLPGLIDFAKEELQLPVRLGKWESLPIVVDNIKGPRYATAVGLMLLDMLLGPAAVYDDVQPGFMQTLKGSASSILKRIKK